MIYKTQESDALIIINKYRYLSVEEKGIYT